MLREAAAWHTAGPSPYACGLQHTHSLQYKYEKIAWCQPVLSDWHIAAFERLYV